MKRLTLFKGHYYELQQDNVEHIYDKLCEYEDTKKSPQEIENMKVKIFYLREIDKANLNIIIDLRKRIDSLQK